MTADDVLLVLTLLRRAGVEVWAGEGWGIDALLGEQTRDRHDMAQLRRAFGIITHV